jgi:hypothetical protein
MKTNYRPGDKVKILRDGLLNNLPGTVLSFNPDTTFRPICVILDGNLGTWQMFPNEVEFLGKGDKADISNKANEAVDHEIKAVKPLKSNKGISSQKTPKKPVKALKMIIHGDSTIITEPSTNNKLENLEVVTADKAKRGRKPSAKVKEVKVKRPYNKKVKTV